MHHRYVTYIKHIVSIYCITYIFTQWKTVYIYTHILSVYHIYEPYIYILYSINASYVIHEISNHIYIDISYIIYLQYHISYIEKNRWFSVRRRYFTNGFHPTPFSRFARNASCRRCGAERPVRETQRRKTRMVPSEERMLLYKAV